jgi:hypothetical protein
MNEKTCSYCKQRFLPSRFHPDQRICSSADCQRRRRAEYHQRKLGEDPGYREQCRHSQEKWRQENPNYMKRYLAKRRALKRSLTGESSVVNELERLLDLARNNRVLDLKSSDATILLICPKDKAGEKNTFALEKNTLAARGGKGPFICSEQWVVGRLRERARR